MLNPLRPVMTRIFTPVGAVLARTPITANAITVKFGVSQAQALSFYRSGGVSGDGIDAAINQGTSVISGGGLAVVAQPLARMASAPIKAEVFMVLCLR